ncbi:MAG: DegT/DnrJ/EryC1/StrS family aminotransferase [Candidatus Thiodiazotropha sp.]
MKSITTARDLAINGAQPRFSEPLHVGRPHVANRDGFLRTTQEILDRLWLTNNGPVVQELERRVADHHQVKHCVAMSSGTLGLEIAIRALQLEGEVILPSHTYVATAHALHWHGLTPVFADIDPATHNIDPESVRGLITERTSAIIGVHLWGRIAPVDQLERLARAQGLKLLYDAAHAFGCSCEGVKVGNFGDCEILSFHATKFFHTLEGGAVLTNQDSLAEQLRLMRNFGFAGVDQVVCAGTNGKLNEISAAMGLANLDALPSLLAHNRQVYSAYRDALAEVPGLSMLKLDESQDSNYQYVVLETDPDCRLERDQIIEALHAENILARRYFWPGCHRMMPYRELIPGAGRHLSRTEQIVERIIVMPAGYAVTPEMVPEIVGVLRTLMD